MTAPPPASPPPKMSQTADQNRKTARAVLSVITSPMKIEIEHLARALRKARAEGRAEGAAEQRKRDADRIRDEAAFLPLESPLHKKFAALAAAIEKETTNE